VTNVAASKLDIMSRTLQAGKWAGAGAAERQGWASSHLVCRLLTGGSKLLRVWSLF